MIANKTNKLNKTEKNKKVKEGPCIFPFKYQWKTHSACIETPKGEICATEINPKTRTLVKYGYCKTLKSSKSKSLSKSTSSKETLKKSKKKKSKEKKIITEDLKISQSNKSTMSEKDKSESPSQQLKPPYNKDFISILDQLNKLMIRKGEPFRAKAYLKAQQEIIKYKKDIQTIDEIKPLSNIGPTIIEKLTEFINSGKIEVLEREKQNPIHIFTQIYGVGPKKAQDLIDKNITTIEQLREPSNLKLLNDKQILGLKYYEDINTRIPRTEIVEYEKILSKIFTKITPSIPGESMFEIVGSYRRGAETSGDIDIIITNSNNNKEIFTKFLDELLKEKIIIELLSRGKTKSLTIGRLPASTSTSMPTARRIDLLYSSPKEYAFAILYFTGSKEFNTVMRQYALTNNYTLNEHGISHMKDGIKDEIVMSQEFPDEKSIFDFLKLKYKSPTERKDGNAVEPISKEEDKKDADIPAKKKNTTLKKQPKKQHDKEIQENLEKFFTEGQSALDSMSEQEVTEILNNADNKYYCDETPIMTDDQYDILKEYILKKYPENKQAKEGHTKCIIEKNKVKLPYEMWSMDKIKPDTKELDKFKTRFNGPYILSCKLDGISALYTTEKDKPQLFTRGNGTVGQDITHVIPFLKLPSQKNITIRGELIIKKKTFDDKFKKDFKNPRNFVAGLVNHKTLTEERKEMLRSLDFVAYEVIIPPNQKPSEQMQYLESLNNTITVKNESIKDPKELTNEILSTRLKDWRDSYEYEIDGVICSDDNVYPRTSKNPEHAFAFKMVLSDQEAEAKVVDVIWTASKHGYLKPRIQIEPITLGGVTITYATGKNARFIEEKKIGLGAIIKIIRSGDVIPEVKDEEGVVIKPAEQPLFPKEPYVWNDTHVDIMVKDKETNQTVLEKTITNFFKSLDVEGIGEGNVKKIIKAGHDSIPKILAMTMPDFLEVEGFKNKMATKLFTNIQAKIESTSIAELAAATNIFGRGMGHKRIEKILKDEPDILTSTALPAEKIKKVKAIQGMAEKTATQFVEKIPEFLEFLKEAKLEDKLHKESTSTKQQQEQEEQEDPDKPKHPLHGKKLLMSGPKDKLLLNHLKKLGAEIQTAPTKETSYVIVKDPNEDTAKANKGRELKILITVKELKEKYDLDY